MNKRMSYGNIILIASDGTITRTVWPSFRSIKNYATRQHWVYEMNGDMLVVSLPNGEIRRYKEKEKPCLKTSQSN